KVGSALALNEPEAGSSAQNGCQRALRAEAAKDAVPVLPIEIRLSVNSQVTGEREIRFERRCTVRRAGICAASRNMGDCPVRGHAKQLAGGGEEEIPLCIGGGVCLEDSSKYRRSARKRVVRRTSG